MKYFTFVILILFSVSISLCQPPSNHLDVHILAHTHDVCDFSNQKKRIPTAVLNAPIVFLLFQKLKDVGWLKTVDEVSCALI